MYSLATKVKRLAKPCALSLLCDRGGVLHRRGRAGQFAETGALTPEDLTAVQQQLRARVLRWFARAGMLDQADARDMARWDHGGGFSLDASVRRSLELEPDNATAIHAIAHVMEMQGRAREGIEWLESTRTAWASNAGFAVHNAWRLALFHVDLDARDKAPAIYDRVLAPAPTSSTAALVDASALLWRLELRGMHLRSRWRKLAKCWKRRPLLGQRAFNLVHAVMAFTAAGQTGLASRAAALFRGRISEAHQQTEQAMALVHAQLGCP